MTVSSLATKSSSIDLVHGEIEATILKAEQSLEAFHENRESSEDLQNCIDYLHQLRGIFVLVELQGGVLLCQEAVSVANEVPVGASIDKNNLLTSLNDSFFVLRRYVEYFEQKREDHPELILPIINELRQARREAPFLDSHFFPIDLNFTNNLCDYLKVDNEPYTGDFELRAKRLRHMYQVALLGLLRGQNEQVNFKLMERACTSLLSLCAGFPLAQLWCLMTVVSKTMRENNMEVSQSRKRLFMKVEKYTKELVYVGKVVTSKTAPDSVRKELIYILALSGSNDEIVMQILDACNVTPAEFNEEKLVSHRSRLFGPGIDVLKSLSEALQNEIAQLKEKLDIMERGVDPDETDLNSVIDLMEKLVSTLSMLGLSKLRVLANEQLQTLKEWADGGETPAEQTLLIVADAILNIELAVKHFENTGITLEADQKAEGYTGLEDSPYLSEALIVVTEEAQSGIALTKKAITAFIESNWDKMHLANVIPTLETVRGSIEIIGETRLSRALVMCIQCIQSFLIEASEKPDQVLLETLADALTSLEYYIETLKGKEAVNNDLLSLAEESMHALGIDSSISE
jgi:hypothetical protein